MSCFICTLPVAFYQQASLDCSCNHKEIGIVHEDCANKWEQLSGFRCALRCGNPLPPPLHPIITGVSCYFIWNSFLLYTFAQNEIFIFCSFVHLIGACFLWLT